MWKILFEECELLDISTLKEARKERGVWMFFGKRSANKRLHMTATALRSFGIIARHKGFGGWAGCVLPVRARFRPVNRGVRAIANTWIVWSLTALNDLRS